MDVNENETRNARRWPRGMAMVETVFVLPLLLMILFGLLEMSVMFGRWQTLSNAAREGARIAVVYRVDCDDTAVRDEVKNTVRSYAAPLGISLSDNDVQVDGVCGAEQNSTVRVSVPYQFEVLPNFANQVSPSIDLKSRSVMRNERTS